MNEDEAAEAFGRILELREAAIDATVSEVYGAFPDWVPQPAQDRVRQAVDTMLSAQQEPATISKLVSEYLRDRKIRYIPGTANEPAAYAYAVSYLAHVLEAINRGPVDGLEILGGGDAVRGRKIVQGAHAGGVAKQATREKTYAQYQSRVDELHQNNPRRTHWDICKTVASELGGNPKTVQRHTTLR